MLILVAVLTALSSVGIRMQHESIFLLHLVDVETSRCLQEKWFQAVFNFGLHSTSSNLKHIGME